MEKLKNFIKVIFYTRKCRYCKRVIDVRKTVCPQCENDIVRIEGDVCYRCGLQTSDCHCKKKAHHYLRICAPYYYSGAAKRAVIRLKYSKDVYIARPLAEDMADTVNKHYGEIDFDFCTFVPSHKKDVKRRGYNQAQLLANELGDILGIPCEELLIKTVITTPQHTLNESMRSGNLLGSIQTNPAFFEKIQNARILLCDDIKTTGSTLDECAKTLLICGAAEVDCVTVCIAKKTKK